MVYHPYITFTIEINLTRTSSKCGMYYQHTQDVIEEAIKLNEMSDNLSELNISVDNRYKATENMNATVQVTIQDPEDGDNITHFKRVRLILEERRYRCPLCPSRSHINCAEVNCTKASILYLNMRNIHGRLSNRLSSEATSIGTIED